MKTRCLAFSLAVLGWLCSSPESLFSAPITLLDQSQTVDNGSNNSGGGGLSARKGQTFTPTLAGVDAVEFLFGGTTDGDSFLVNVRATDAPGLTGTILGTSGIVNFNTTTSSETTAHFDFPAVVPLVPGNQYAIELVPQTLGSGVFALRVNTGDVYAGGEYYTSATNTIAADAWFREGLHEALPTPIPEPSSLALLFTGLFVLVKRRQMTLARRAA